MSRDEQQIIETPEDETAAPTSGGFMKFYGLYWRKEFIFSNQRVLAGAPRGWIGKGTKSIEPSVIWMNFWDQKGVYVLYDEQLTPVYTGQAGLTRKTARSKSSDGGRCLGERLKDHAVGKYRNGWSYFSWFGFLSAGKEDVLRGKLKSADLKDRRDPDWRFSPSSGESELNLLLDSFEAILIEAFTPRFNSRGGNLKNAEYVDQLERQPAFIESATV